MATAHELVSDLPELPDGAFVTSVVMVIQYELPGDDEHIGPALYFTRDHETPAWVHAGMIESARGDLQAIMAGTLVVYHPEGEYDDDDDA